MHVANELSKEAAPARIPLWGSSITNIELSQDTQGGVSNFCAMISFPSTYGTSSCIVSTTLGLFLGGTKSLEDDLCSLFLLGANMRFNTKNGYHYNAENITYTCSRNEWPYMYTQVASILEAYKEENHVSIMDINAKVEHTLEYTSTLDPLALCR